MNKNLLVTVLFLITISGFAQFKNHPGSFLGFALGLNQVNWNTKDLEITPLTGFQGGISLRGNVYRNFDLVYGLQFTQVKFMVNTTNPSTNLTENIDYKLPGGQIYLLISYKLYGDNLSVELGPVIQYNDKLNFDAKYENYPLVNSLLKVRDFSDITNLNANLAAGTTFGIKNIRLQLQYQLGLNNLLSKANNPDLIATQNYIAKEGILSASLVSYF
jgi:hypothetical protein